MKRQPLRKRAAAWLPTGIDPGHAALEASLPTGREAEIATVFEAKFAADSRPGSRHKPIVDPILSSELSHSAKRGGLESKCRCLTFERKRRLRSR